MNITNLTDEQCIEILELLPNDITKGSIEYYHRDKEDIKLIHIRLYTEEQDRIIDMENIIYFNIRQLIEILTKFSEDNKVEV